MGKKIFSLLVIAAIGAAFYFMLSYHFFFFGRSVKMVKKAKIGMNYIFVNVKPTEFRTPDKIMRDKALRAADVGQILVDFGIITDEQKAEIEEQIEKEESS